MAPSFEIPYGYSKPPFEVNCNTSNSIKAIDSNYSKGFFSFTWLLQSLSSEINNNENENENISLSIIHCFFVLAICFY